MWALSIMHKSSTRIATRGQRAIIRIASPLTAPCILQWIRAHGDVLGRVRHASVPHELLEPPGIHAAVSLHRAGSMPQAMRMDRKADIRVASGSRDHLIDGEPAELLAADCAALARVRGDRKRYGLGRTVAPPCAKRKEKVLRTEERVARPLAAPDSRRSRSARPCHPSACWRRRAQCPGKPMRLPGIARASRTTRRVKFGHAALL